MRELQKSRSESIHYSYSQRDHINLHKVSKIHEPFVLSTFLVRLLIGKYLLILDGHVICCRVANGEETKMVQLPVAQVRYQL